MSSIAATNEDPDVIALTTTLEKVRTRSNEYVSTWMSRMNEQRIRRIVAEWRSKQCPPPCSDKVKEALLAEDTVA